MRTSHSEEFTIWQVLALFAFKAHGDGFACLTLFLNGDGFACLTLFLNGDRA
ncbi:hypothetical protein VEA_003145 [Vibrio antiquarius]|uniref:Uncharacterized protein n=1 Tax=Vibrio antiquarius (strain Ex25) TaxID=150340 RepID=A0ACA6QMB5_VIBAE|nr:hypothetical protein VEA_003145 [Vibrio antiquarius]